MAEKGEGLGVTSYQSQREQLCAGMFWLDPCEIYFLSFIVCSAIPSSFSLSFVFIGEIILRRNVPAFSLAVPKSVQFLWLAKFPVMRKDLLNSPGLSVERDFHM